MFLRIQTPTNMSLPEALLPYQRKWVRAARKIDDSIRRGNEIAVGNDVELAQHHIKIVSKHFETYEDAWDKFAAQLDEAAVTDTSFTNCHDRVTTDKWECLQSLTELRKREREEAAKPKSKIEVPTVRIPEFSGQHERWTEFWEAFNNVIHSNATLTSAIKFTHLRGALKGDAAQLIQGFELNDDNYTQVIDLLKKKYEDPNKTKRVLIHQLLDLQLSQHNLKEINIFHDNLQKILRSLTSLVQVNEAEWILKEILLRKLPRETQNFLYNLYKTSYLTVKQIKDGLYNLIELLEANPEKGKTKETRDKDRTHTEGTERKNDKSRAMWQASVNPNCILCKENHNTGQCPTYSFENKLARLRELKLCSRCGKPWHPNKCPIKSPCRKCQGEHYTYLCCKKQVQTNITHKGEHPKEVEVKRTEGTNVKKVNAKGGGVALPTAQLDLGRKDKTLRVRGFFDTGSQISFVHPSVLEKLNIKYEPHQYLEVSPFGKDLEVIEGQYVKLTISLGKRKFQLRFFATEKVRMRAYVPGLKETLRRFKNEGYKLADPLASDQIDDVDVVVGADYFGKLIGRVKLIRGVNVFCSPGGYLIFGKLPFGQHQANNQPTVLQSVQMKRATIGRLVDNEIIPTTPPLHKLWELEAIGIQGNQQCRTDEKVVETFSQTIQKDDLRYLVTFPFKQDPESLPTNHGMASMQLKSLLSKLKKDRNIQNCYHRIILEYEQLGFIEEVKGAVQGHYLPHHPVHKESTTTPIRIVFNASASCGGNPSLNDLLETGPTLTEKLVDSLLTFRQGKYALCSDIAKAFLRVGLQISERDYVRFLWVDNPNKKNPKIKTFRFTSIPFGTTSSPFLLQATLYRHLTMSETPWKAKLLRSFYVDNFSTTTDQESDLIDIYETTTTCLAKANMPLQEWNSNSHVFNDWLQDKDRKPALSVLGIHWDTESDTVNIKNVTHTLFSRLTKRTALSYVSELYDPLGLISPIGIRGRILMRELWLLKLGWDDSLDEKWVQEINKLSQCYALASEIKFPRMSCLLNDTIDLHVFCDASAAAYGAVAYTVTISGSQLVMSKSRVSPVKGKSIPQLELTAMLIGCRLVTYLLANLQCNISNIYVWTDNLPCVSWIKNNNSNIVYVRNRVGEIMEIQKETGMFINHVRTKENKTAFRVSKHSK